MQMSLVGDLLKSWNLIPQDHEIDHELLLSIVDKDKDGIFSPQDFKMNLPAFSSKSVAKHNAVED